MPVSHTVSGYGNSCGKIIGGINSVALVEKCNIETVTFDPFSQSYTDITLKERCKFAFYKIPEGAARYKENVRRTGTVVVVDHYLEFDTKKIESESRNALMEIVNASLCGLIAIVTTSQGYVLIIGISPHLLDERPLRLSAASTDTGKEPTDSSENSIMLSSSDTSKAYLFSGSILI